MDRISRRGLLAGGAAAVAALPATGSVLGSAAAGDHEQAGGAVAICGPVPPNLDGLTSGIAARIPKFADLGAEFGVDGNRIVEAVRASGPEQSPAEPGWVPTMTAIGDEALARARTAASARRSTKARNRFMEASFWYFLARFPHVLSPAGGEAYDKHVSAYLSAARYFDPPLEEVAVPFEGSSFPAYLRRPRRGGGPCPAVVVWGGMDIWKSELEVHLETEALLRLGIATLVIDMPGTGQSPILVSPDAERAPLAAIEFLRGRRGIDAQRIAVWGLSFGGHFAVKLALQLAGELAGAVNVGGPVHHTWTPEHLESLPEGAVITLAAVLGLEPDAERPEIAEHIAGLSLVAQGLLPADRSAPLLSINGDLDELIPISDLHVIGEYGVRQDRMIYGEDGHVAGRNWRQHQQLAATWLATKLTCVEPT